jgi:hypothetical protein
LGHVSNCLAVIIIFEALVTISYSLVSLSLTLPHESDSITMYGESYLSSSAASNNTSKR